MKRILTLLVVLVAIVAFGTATIAVAAEKAPAAGKAKAGDPCEIEGSAGRASRARKGVCPGGRSPSAPGRRSTEACGAKGRS